MKVRPTNPYAKDAAISGGPQPYTETGLARLLCARCGKEPAAEQFMFRSCALGGSRVHLPLCLGCDADLNEMVLRFFAFAGVDIDKAMAYYREQQGLTAPAKPAPTRKRTSSAKKAPAKRAPAKGPK